MASDKTTMASHHGTEYYNTMIREWTELEDRCHGSRARSIILGAVEDYRSAAQPGEGYRGVILADGHWDHAAQGSRRAIVRLLDEVGFEAGEEDGKSRFVLFVGLCVYGQPILHGV